MTISFGTLEFMKGLLSFYKDLPHGKKYKKIKSSVLIAIEAVSAELLAEINYENE